MCLVPRAALRGSIREGTYPSLDHPGRLLGRGKVLRDEEKFAWETGLGGGFQREGDQVQGNVAVRRPAHRLMQLQGGLWWGRAWAGRPRWEEA